MGIQYINFILLVYLLGPDKHVIYILGLSTWQNSYIMEYIMYLHRVDIELVSNTCLGTCITTSRPNFSKFIDLTNWQKLQVDGSKNILLKFVNLTDTLLRVGVCRSLVHFTLKTIKDAWHGIFRNGDMEQLTYQHWNHML